MSGPALRALRRRAGLTQEEFARKLGLKRLTLHRYETGKREIPTHVAIAATCVVLHGG